MIEDAVPSPWTWPSSGRSATLHAVSHDPSLREIDRRCRTGARLTAVQLQWAYLEQAPSLRRVPLRRRR